MERRGRREIRVLGLVNLGAADLHDLTEAVLDVGGEGESYIGGEIGDPNALRDHLDRLLGDDAHRLSRSITVRSSLASHLTAGNF